MNSITNNSGLSIAMAVWLAHETYTDGSEAHLDENVISATALLKSPRQFILSKRVPPTEQTIDLTDLIAARLGHAVHDSIEDAWLTGHAAALEKVGYPKKMISSMRINPEEVEPGTIPVYLEQRAMKPITVEGYRFLISGKFDQIIGGELNDTKTTSVFGYINDTNDFKYAAQGSIYRWLNPDKITSDIIRIQHLFTDWQRSQVKINPKYPPHRVVEKKVKLWSLKETERWITERLRILIQNQSLPEPEIVSCTDEDLWMTAPQFKYYSDPQKAAQGGRSTKNFPNYPAAASYRNKQGKGVVITVPGEPKACAYCAGFSVCSQKDQYEAYKND